MKFERGKLWCAAVMIVAVATAAFGSLRADINGDGIVDFADFSILASEWLCEDAMYYQITQLSTLSNMWWRGIVATPEGTLYASDYSTDIFKKEIGDSEFVRMDATNRYWTQLELHPSGDIYALVENTAIYRQDYGQSGFTNLNQTVRQWRGIGIDHRTGDVYAVVNNGDIYKRTEGGDGTFAAMSQTSRFWKDVCVSSAGDIYACAESVIYKLSEGAFVPIITAGSAVLILTADFSGNVYAATATESYRIVNDVSLAPLNLPHGRIDGWMFDATGTLYYCVNGGYIYKGIPVEFMVPAGGGIANVTRMQGLRFGKRKF